MVINILRKISHSYSTTESVARRATNEDIFGPSTEDLQELTKLTYKPKALAKIMSVVDHRFEQSDRHWRQKSKTLTMLQYFLIHGSPGCLHWMQQHDGVLQSLCEFKYLDSRNNDQGRSVRDKAQSLLQVLNDPKRLEEAKREYKRQREGVRKSIGLGRPSTQSRNTLEMMRENIFDDPADIGGAFKSATSPPPSTANLAPVETDSNRNYGGLSAIEEER